MRDSWKEEIVCIESMSRKGYTLGQIAEHYGVSRQRILQVVQRYLPDLPREERGISVRAKKKEEEFLANIRLKTGRDTWIHKSDLSKAMAQAFARKKQNSKKSGWDWDILPSDLIFPIICPILDIEIDWFSEKTCENSPSFDRIDNTRGYVKGNVIIISQRANRIKMHGTAEEHRKVADYLDAFINEIYELGC